MSQPFGFVPPVAIPALGGAANAIIPTTGILGGAAAGAKAGAVLGPKGALIGGLIGGITGGLLLPLPTNPGTLPPGLDPGLNDPEPTPEPELPPTPDGAFPVPEPPGTQGVTKRWRVYYRKYDRGADYRYCTSGNLISPGFPPVLGDVQDYAVYGTALTVNIEAAWTQYFCDNRPTVNRSVTVLKLIATNEDGSTTETNVRNDNIYELGTNGTSYHVEKVIESVKIVSIEADGEPQPLPFPEPETPTKPRPTPIPLKPLPAPDPVPEPAPVPIPEPEPQPEPLEVPSPDNPTAPPITIPKAPPAVPQAPPKPSPFPIPGPNQPGTVPIPQPIPGVPTVPEPSPDPNVVPAPGPTPLPSPGPTPVPGTDPQPGETPIPVPPQTPIPTIPATPTTPDTSTPTTPDGSVAPQPTPLPVPTPPNVHFPVPGAPPVTDGGVRPDLASIAAEVGRIEQKTAQLQSNQKDIPWWLIGPILEALGALLEQDIPGTTYQLQGICEDVAPGQDQPLAQFPVAPAKNLGAIINRLDTIDQMLQQHLAWKTPTCKTRITPQGDWRTISFISDEVSPYGKSRLRKRFRYRSLSGVGLSGVIDHWKDFVWQAGPVCVQHAGSSWGTPQCWAASVDEGKRVIRHAAGEAGIDPDQDGRWVISGSDSARVGVPGTMRVNRKGGYYWITARDGSEGRPLVGTVDSPP